MKGRRFSCLAATLLLLFGANTARAQLTNASAAALGMGDNYTAAARGFNAVAWNPAALGLRDAPGSSLTVLALRGGNGLAPVTLSDLGAYSNRVVPDAVRRDWLTRIVADGAQRGEGEYEATWLALQHGTIAVHAGTRVRALTDVSPGVAELIMFGNAGRDGEARDLDLSGSSLDARAYTTLGASLALPYDTERGRFSLGATVTYTMGHVLADGENSSGGAWADPITVQLDFPVVQTSIEDGPEMNAGSGFGLDLGAALQSGPWTLSALARNVTSSFAWDQSELIYRPLSFDIAEAVADGSTDARPLSGAPEDVRTRIDAIGFQPSWAFGAAYRPDARLLVTGDARFAKEDGMFAHPVRHMGAGIEYHLLPWLPVRAGGALVKQTEDDSGHMLSGGMGIRAGIWSINASLARRESDRMGKSTIFMVGMSLGELR
jgi:hypothetical protein